MGNLEPERLLDPRFLHLDGEPAGAPANPLFPIVGES
jgi:hypothetical protein